MKGPDIRKELKKAKPPKHETIRLEKPDEVCRKCDQHYLKYVGRPVVVVSCEGAGLRGEVARRAARFICEKLFPGDTARVCLGAAFSYDGGPRHLAGYAPKTLVLDGCSIKCASRMLNSAAKGIHSEVLVTDRLYRFDKGLVEVSEMSEGRLNAHARTVACKAAARIRAFLKKHRKY